MEYILKTKALTKKYKRQLAVNGADINVKKGDIYGFVGENGSGKTTVIRLVTGLIFPTSGEFELFGVKNTEKEITAARRRVGAIVESPSIYQNMSAGDNLRMQCSMLGIEDNGRVAEVLETVGLGGLYNIKKHAGDFSLGMRQRLGIAMALLGDPELIILDEPMNGLDPAGIVDIRELILRLNREKGITFIISSHILTELSLVANKYGIISKGRIIEEITAAELHEKCGKHTDIKVSDPEQLFIILSESLGAERLSYIPEGVRISGEVELNLLLGEIISKDIKILSINCGESSFEDYYLSVIGGKRND